MSRAWLQLLRLPNLFTVPGDPLAGFLLAYAVANGHGAQLEYRAALAVAASMCLYAAGLITNDLFDLDEDRRDRPSRPLTSGQISPRQAWTAATIFSIIGAISMYSASGSLGVEFAAGLLVCITLYNAVSKHVPLIGAVNMGLCRGLSVLLGAVAYNGRAWPQEGMVITGAVIISAYIAAVTNLARHETKRSAPVGARFLPALVLLLAFLLFQAGRLPFLTSPATTALGIALIVCSVEIGRIGRKEPAPLPPIIGALIRVLLLLQAALCLVFPSPHAWITAGMLVLAIPIARHFGRKFYAS